MPLFPYLPVIVWMGMIRIALDATDIDERDTQHIDPDHLMMNYDNIIAFPAAAA